MEDITRGPDDPDDPDTLMCSFDDEDASRNAMKKARKYFFPIHPIPRFFVDSAFLLSHKDDHDPSSSTPLPRRVGVVVGLTTAFAVPSRESTSKPREETVHTWTMSTADKGNHGRWVVKTKTKTKQIWHGAATSRCALLAPIVFETRVQ